MADYRKIVPFILKWEGGLSRDQADTASANPVPDGSGYHTNKGVTWATFAGLAAKGGYNPTPEVFYAMPSNVWAKVFKVGFWDAIQGDKISNQAIADILADLAWASGPARAAKTVQRALNDLGFNVTVDSKIGPKTLAAINQANPKQLFTAIHNHKVAFFQALNQPRFLQGWLNRANDLFNEKKNYLQ